jgi:hypothetical protein
MQFSYIFIPEIEFLLRKTAQMPNISYLLVRHIPFTLKSDTFLQLIATDFHISLRNETKNSRHEDGKIYSVREALF